MQDLNLNSNDSIDESEEEYTNHPVAILLATAGTSVLVGMAASYFIRKHQEKQMMEELKTLEHVMSTHYDL